MTKEIIIILLVIALYYYYRQSKTQPHFISPKSGGDELSQVKSANQTLTSFLRNNLNSSSLEELKTKLGEKTLDEVLEQNEDRETEVDTLTRSKNSLEQDLTAQAEAFQSRIREKDREVKKLKEDLSNEQKRINKIQESLTSEKQQHKGSLERISLLTKQVGDLEKEKNNRPKSPMPGEFPENEKIVELEKRIKELEEENKHLTKSLEQLD